MEPYRHWKHQRAPAHHARDPANRVAQGQFLGAHDSHRLPRQSALQNGSLHNAGDVFHSIGPDGLVLVSNEGKQWERVKCMTQVVEHVIASAINDSALEYGVIQSAASHELLRRPFGLVVRRAAVWTSSQKADENYLLNACSMSGIRHVSSAVDMHAPVGLL